MSFTLPDLPYDFDALEPHIDKQTMMIHHDKHHQGYVNKLNKAVEKEEKFKKMEIEELLMHVKDVPEEIRTSVINSGGGHANHSLFWKVMTPNYKEPEGEIKDALTSTFGSVDKFKERFSETASGRFGSGWAWLVVKDGKLELYSTANQDSPYMNGDVPILGLDVWEHAYYLKYQNERGKYIKSWWNVVNWEQVNKNLQEAAK